MASYQTCTTPLHTKTHQALVQALQESSPYDRHATPLQSPGYQKMK